VKCGRLRWVGHVAREGSQEMYLEFLVRKVHFEDQRREGRLELNVCWFDRLLVCKTVGSIIVSYRASVLEALSLRCLLSLCHD
jgi:hypothetical protein